jgi:hypothetical protein
MQPVGWSEKLMQVSCRLHQRVIQLIQKAAKSFSMRSSSFSSNSTAVKTKQRRKNPYADYFSSF